MKKITSYCVLFCIFIALNYYLFFYLNGFSSLKNIFPNEEIKVSSYILLSKVYKSELIEESKIAHVDKKKITNLKKEKFKYGIYLAGLKIGESVISFEGSTKLNGKDVLLITMESKAPNFYDYEEIYGNSGDFTPVLVKRKIKLFGENIEITEEYNQEEKEVVITRKSKKTTIEKITSENRLNNIILFLFYFRTKKALKIGEKFTFNLPTKSLEMEIVKSVPIKTPCGRFNAYYLRSLPAKFKAWFSNDENLMPLRIDGAVGFGNTRLILIEKPS